MDTQKYIKGVLGTMEQSLGLMIEEDKPFEKEGSLGLDVRNPKLVRLR